MHIGEYIPNNIGKILTGTGVGTVFGQHVWVQKRNDLKDLAALDINAKASQNLAKARVRKNRLGYFATGEERYQADRAFERASAAVENSRELIKFRHLNREQSILSAAAGAAKEVASFVGVK